MTDDTPNHIGNFTVDDLAVHDFLSGQTQTLAEPIAPISEDRARIDALRTLRESVKTMPLPLPKPRISFMRVTGEARRRAQAGGRKGRLSWLTGGKIAGLVTAAGLLLTVALGSVFSFSGTLSHEAPQAPIATNHSAGYLAKRSPEALRAALDEDFMPPLPTPEDGHTRDTTRGFSANNSGGGSGAGTSKVNAPFDASAFGALMRSGSIHLRDAKPGDVQATIITKVNDVGGFIRSLNRTGVDKDTIVVMEVDVPSEHYRAFVTSMGTLGEVLGQTENVEDATGALVSYEALLAEAKDYLVRLDKLVEKPQSSMSELQNLEKERRDTRRHIEEYSRALERLNKRVRMGTLSIRVTAKQPEPAKAVETEQLGPFEEAWQDGTRGLSLFLAFMLKACLAALPVLVITILAVLWLRRRNMSRRGEPQMDANARE